MTFAKPTDTPGQPLNVIYAEHILQLIGVLTGQIDGGALQFLGQVAAPATAPTVTLSAGALNGSYEWGAYWITGAADGTGSYAVTGRTTPSPYSAAQTLANQQGTVSIAGQAIPTGVVGWGVVRNQAGGGTWYEVPGSEQFMNNAGVMPTSFVDNVADGNLVTAAPATNTTGTSLSGEINATTASQINDYNGGHSIKATWTGSAIEFEVDSSSNEPVAQAENATNAGYATNAGTASNANALGGQPPSYYAPTSSIPTNIATALSGGTKIQSGQQSTGNNTITFPTAFTSTPIVVATINYAGITGASNSFAMVMSVSTTQAVIYNSAGFTGGGSYYDWVAIGN